MNRVRHNPMDAEQRKRQSLMLYTMLLIAGDRKTRQRIIDAGAAAGLDRRQIDADLRRYRMVEHA